MQRKTNLQQKRTLKAAYDDCAAAGFFQPRALFDSAKIQDNLKLSEGDLSGGKKLAADGNLNSAYKLFYDSLHVLAESLLMFDKIKSLNHQCLFTCLCLKHTELGLDWAFFERVRIRRNGINYYARLVDELEWKEDCLMFQVYIRLLRAEVVRRLKLQSARQ